MKSILRRLKALNIRQLSSLLWLGLRYPRYIFPTLKATQHCVYICDTHFGKSHHQNNQANAFRHALWNVLIIQYNKQRSLARATAWAKRFTDWHEEFAPNAPLAKAMDLHNNAIGRALITQFPREEEPVYVEQLLKKVTLSRKLTHIDDLSHFEQDLVHIEDYP